MQNLRATLPQMEKGSWGVVKRIRSKSTRHLNSLSPFFPELETN